MRPKNTAAAAATVATTLAARTAIKPSKDSWKRATTDSPPQTTTDNRIAPRMPSRVAALSSLPA
jgi:hypothetical protein